MKKANEIIVRYDDGSMDCAYGNNARQIVDYIFGCQGLAAAHGFTYDGPKLTTYPPFKDPSFYANKDGK